MAAHQLRFFTISALLYPITTTARGVIVAVDPVCMAGDTWYKTNKTQPNRDQPWYHVLVHDSGGLSTYVAHSNLEQDTSGQEINHPRIGCYFTKLENGRYGLKKMISVVLVRFSANHPCRRRRSRD